MYPCNFNITTSLSLSDLLVTWLYKMTVSDEPDYKLAATIGIVIFIVMAAINLIVYNMIPSVKNEEDFQ